jgi:hypothetical protein
VADVLSGVPTILEMRVGRGGGDCKGRWSKMERMMRITRGAGKIILALLAAVLIPILIWVALGVAVYKKIRQRQVQRKPAPTMGQILAAAGLTIREETMGGTPVAAMTFTQQSATQFQQLLGRVGLTIHDEPAPKHCWEILHCPPEKQKACPTYARRDLPSWVAIGLGKDKEIGEVCANSTLVDLKKLPSRA